jgi:hypothetical protein
MPLRASASSNFAPSRRLVRDATGNFTMGLIAIAIGPAVSAILVLLLGHDRRLEQIPTRQVATP